MQEIYYGNVLELCWWHINYLCCCWFPCLDPNRMICQSSNPYYTIYLDKGGLGHYQAHIIEMLMESFSHHLLIGYCIGKN
ncbi:hypothetical protein C2S52_023466 [Perilla frutescens var. hirtella]|nr:hypothetical protein C2S52_023466 [Perilla frutescens var. hirtella]KAH6772290.1 hypothetical protein C2S51_010694 [Perilla frutescens var. frutescens]